MSDGLIMPDVSKELLEEFDIEYGNRRFAQLRKSAKETQEVLEYVREKAKGLKGFWSFTLMTHQLISNAISSKSDRDALAYVTDIELVQDINDPRPYILKFHFSENPFFSDSILEKKYDLKEGIAKGTSDEITKEMREYSEEDLVASTTKINWKSEDKNLISKQPRAKRGDDEDDDDFEGDAGSFFHFFTETSDPYGIGPTLVHDLLPDVIGYFTGRGEHSLEGFYEDSDEDDELDEEDEEDDEGSIDLDEEEQAPKKKQKTK